MRGVIHRLRTIPLFTRTVTALLFIACPTFLPGIALAGGRFAPADGQSYFGFTLRFWDGPALTNPAYGDTRPFSDRYSDAIQVELGGKLPSFFAVPTIWQDATGTMNTFSSTLTIINKFLPYNSSSSPLISWNAQTGWDYQAPDYSGITTQTILGGSLDTYIHQYAQDVKAYAKPVFIRLICGEVNGAWAKNCSPRANPNLTTQNFVDAWRHVADIFKQEGVTNVAWVWSVNSFPAPPSDWGIDTNIASYYPGDNYVDWTSVDHYDYGDPSLASENPLNVATYLDPHYTFATGQSKPMLIVEWGVRHPGSDLMPSQQQQWIMNMFGYVGSHPGIKGTVYFNYDMAIPYATTADHTFLYNNQVNYAPNDNNGDSRLVAESGANFRGTFANAIASSRYISTVAAIDTVPPSVANNLAATVISSSQINLAWSASTDNVGVAGYRIYRGAALIATISGTTYSNTGLAPSTTYSYTVAAYDAAGNISAPSSSTSAATNKFPLGASVRTTAKVSVMSSPGGSMTGKQQSGATGKVIGGPARAAGYTWWNIDFVNGSDGWVVEDGLQKV
jgi:hypothetical protein